ncbi:MAG: hypothetical protein H6724_07110 [Sandaracinus sp.]|nr:hypothetical protein [Sandaracinus sp.]
MVLTREMHNATRVLFNRWRAARGWAGPGRRVPWNRVSPQEAQALANDLFRAAGVPEEVVQQYFREFNRYLYGIQ